MSPAAANRLALTLIAACAASLLSRPAAQAQTPGYQVFVLGGGGGMITNEQPCPDITCNTGDTCSCITGSGSLKAELEGGKHSIPGTFTLEVSADDTDTINNGSTGRCFGSTGYVTIAVPKGTFKMPFSGLGCRIPFTPDQRTFGISAPTVIASGTGVYVNAVGTGAFNASFSPTSGVVTFNLPGYAAFHR